MQYNPLSQPISAVPAFCKAVDSVLNTVIAVDCLGTGVQTAARKPKQNCKHLPDDQPHSVIVSAVLSVCISCRSILLSNSKHPCCCCLHSDCREIAHFGYTKSKDMHRSTCLIRHSVPDHTFKVLTSAEASDYLEEVKHATTCLAHLWQLILAGSAVKLLLAQFCVQTQARVL